MNLPVIGLTPRLEIAFGGWGAFGSRREKGLQAKEIAQHAKNKQIWVWQVDCD